MIRRYDSSYLISNFYEYHSDITVPRRPLTFKEKFHLYFHGIPYKKFKPPEPKPGMKTLLLDLDETLIHTACYKPDPKIEYFKLPNSTDYVYLRPGVREFMKYAYENFDLFIYTASVQSYADYIIDRICPQIPSDHRFYRDSCFPDGEYVKKDISIVKRNENDLIMVDDNYGVFLSNRVNSLMIEPFKGYPDDTLLLKWLMPILQRCQKARDVRPILSHAHIQRRLSDSRHMKMF